MLPDFSPHGRFATKKIRHAAVESGGWGRGGLGSRGFGVGVRSVVQPKPQPPRPQPIAVVGRIFHIGTVANVCPTLTLKFSVTFLCRVKFIRACERAWGSSSRYTLFNITHGKKNRFFKVENVKHSKQKNALINQITTSRYVQYANVTNHCRKITRIQMLSIIVAKLRI